MASHWRRIGRIGAIAACCVLVGLTLPASAQEESSVLVDEPAAVAPMPAEEVAPVESPAVCCPPPCISYRTHLRARRMLRRQEQVQVVMLADNPADCVDCPVEVPLCIPACCTGEPVVTSRCGLLGRGIVEYSWCCGFSATTVFRARGDVVVHYGG